MREPQYDLRSVEGFNRQYEENLPHAETQEAAYQATECDHIEKYNCRRYANFHSFRISRNQWLNIRRKNRGQSRQAA